MGFTEKKRTKFLALPICFTTYFIVEESVRIRRGFLNIVEDDAYMYKIQDVRLTKSLMERIFGLGTLTCYTGDTTHPELKLIHIKHASEIKDFLMDASEEARRRRRTMHTMDIDADDDLDDDAE
ncbi:MAG: PH domain-containing protein [Lachnospiraceae bacterium]|nr:PH domain-containing protein [Lachnospiraceae bacterium]